MILKIIKNILLKFSDLKEATLSGQGVIYKLAILGGPFPASYIGCSRNILPVLKRCVGISKRLCLCDTPDRISVTGKQAVDCAAINAELRSNRVNSFPGNVTTDDIVDVIVREYMPCHLYNLQTQNGTYLANDIIAQSQGNVNKYAIVHNCHCVLITDVEV